MSIKNYTDIPYEVIGNTPRYESFDNLVGKHVENLFVSEGEQTLCFVLDNGKNLFYETFGDCCSESWWADVVGVDNLLGHTVLSVERIDLPDEECSPRTRQEYDRVYGYKIKTDRGYVDLVFRNSSNVSLTVMPIILILLVKKYYPCSQEGIHYFLCAVEGNTFAVNNDVCA